MNSWHKPQQRFQCKALAILRNASVQFLLQIPEVHLASLSSKRFNARQVVLAKLLSTIVGSRLGHWKQLPDHSTDWPSQGTESSTTVGKLVLIWGPQKLKPKLLIPTLLESHQQNEYLQHHLWHHLTPSDPGNLNHSHNLSCKGVWKCSYLYWRRWGHMLKEANPQSTHHRRNLVKCITF